MYDADKPPQPLTLLQLNRGVAAALAAATGLNNVWVVAQTSDLRVSGGHCYMELLHKDTAGTVLAKARAMIWASTYARLAARFSAATGTRLASDMKVLVRASVNFHPVYGLSLVISDIDPSYTVGDLVRRRNEILARLRAEGVLDLNRTLPWPRPANRVAIISAAGAAGYGDFAKHLLGNAQRLRFDVELFGAFMQGERAAASIIGALGRVMEREDEFDCVVIIRGGGAVSDLACFDNYDLASHIAQFPLPVIVGIGHERDICVLDYVAAARAKTPTAAAELLIGKGAECCALLTDLGRSILGASSERLAGQHRQLEYYRGQVPALARACLTRGHARLQRWSGGTIAAMASMALAGARARLERLPAEAFRQAATTAIANARARLASMAEVADALSPVATLRRGYTITRCNGRPITDAAALSPGDTITTAFARGEAISTVRRSSHGADPK